MRQHGVSPSIVFPRPGTLLQPFDLRPLVPGILRFSCALHKKHAPAGNARLTAHFFFGSFVGLISTNNAGRGTSHKVSVSNRVVAVLLTMLTGHIGGLVSGVNGLV